MDAKLIIDRLGGTFAVAKICNVKPPSVSDWKKHGIPEARLQYLRLLRPDVFGPAPQEGVRDAISPAPSKQEAA